jgi:hypothetical protein
MITGQHHEAYSSSATLRGIQTMVLRHSQHSKICLQLLRPGLVKVPESRRYKGTICATYSHRCSEQNPAQDAATVAFFESCNQSLALCETMAASCPPDEVPEITSLIGAMGSGTIADKFLTTHSNASQASFIGTGYVYAGLSR